MRLLLSTQHEVKKQSPESANSTEKAPTFKSASLPKVSSRSSLTIARQGVSNWNLKVSVYNARRRDSQVRREYRLSYIGVRKRRLLEFLYRIYIPVNIIF